LTLDNFSCIHFKTVPFHRERWQYRWGHEPKSVIALSLCHVREKWPH